MAIDNKLNAGKIKILYLVVPFVFTIFIATTIYFEFFESYRYLIIVAILFVLIVLILSNLKFRYILFDIKDNKILLRYHGLGPVGANFKSIEFPAKNLAKFELQDAFWGFRKELILFQQTKKGLAKYPGVSLSAMSAKDREKLLAVLSNVLKLKGKKGANLLKF
jgi:hypothetical protein